VEERLAEWLEDLAAGAGRRLVLPGAKGAWVRLRPLTGRESCLREAVAGDPEAALRFDLRHGSVEGALPRRLSRRQREWLRARLEEVNRRTPADGELREWLRRRSGRAGGVAPFDPGAEAERLAGSLAPRREGRDFVKQSELGAAEIETTACGPVEAALWADLRQWGSCAEIVAAAPAWWAELANGGPTPPSGDLGHPSRNGRGLRPAETAPYPPGLRPEEGGQEGAVRREGVAGDQFCLTPRPPLPAPAAGERGRTAEATAGENGDGRTAAPLRGARRRATAGEGRTAEAGESGRPRLREAEEWRPGRPAGAAYWEETERVRGELRRRVDWAR
jgi:hypothetical protein